MQLQAFARGERVPHGSLVVTNQEPERPQGSSRSTRSSRRRRTRRPAGALSPLPRWASQGAAALGSCLGPSSWEGGPDRSADAGAERGDSAPSGAARRRVLEIWSRGGFVPQPPSSEPPGCGWRPGPGREAGLSEASAVKVSQARGRGDRPAKPPALGASVRGGPGEARPPAVSAPRSQSSTQREVSK